MKDFNLLHLEKLPNTLTFLRIFFVPLICLMITYQTASSYFVAFIFFNLAGLTDFFDGYVAHKINSCTDFGAFLDPLADKILITMTFFFLSAVGRLSGILLWLAAIMILREIIILGLRSASGFHKFPVITMAKWKTALQFISGCLLLWPTAHKIITYSIYYAMISSAVLSWMSAFFYIRQFCKLRQSH
jgi:CDP-diacylglycerol--glycerol-3-phosphate 3-phosphatidyltransferase